ncbi:DNA helicase [Tanacetum coccineum]
MSSQTSSYVSVVEKFNEKDSDIIGFGLFGIVLETRIVGLKAPTICCCYYDIWSFAYDYPYLILTSGIKTFGDATTQRKHRRISDIENLSGNIIGLALWNEMETDFDMHTYNSLPKLVVIAVSSCWVSRYNGLQLPGTSTTHYYLNPDIPEMYHIKHQHEQSTSTTPFLTINNQRYDGPKFGKNKEPFPTSNAACSGPT